MSEFHLEFVTTEPPHARFLSATLYGLVTDGVWYGGGQYPGSYRVIPSDHSEESYVQAEDTSEQTGRLAEAVNTYVQFDPAETELALLLALTTVDPPINFFLQIRPAEDRHWRVPFVFDEAEIETDTRFNAAIRLCRETFERGKFSHGLYRTEYEQPVPTDIDELTPTIVNFYSKSVANQLGREKLLSAPADTLVEFDDGGLMILACSEPWGCGEEIELLKFEEKAPPFTAGMNPPTPS